MIVSSFFTFSPFLSGLGPVDDVAYPPVVRAQLADVLALALALAFDQYCAQAGCTSFTVLNVVRGGLPIVEAEPDTRAWFASRFGPTTFGIFDVFP